MDPNTCCQGKSEQLRYNSFFLNGAVLSEWGDTKAWKQTNTLVKERRKQPSRLVGLNP